MWAIDTDINFLREWYTQEHVHATASVPLNLHRVAVFMAATLIMGGVPADVTLSVGAIIQLYADVEGARYVVESFAYGVELGDPMDPTVHGEVPNYVPQEYVEKMNT